MAEPQPDLEPPQHGLYMLFLLVLVFFLMGLVGFMICHVLKKKGYRCRTSRGSEPDDTQLQPPDDDDMNEDTVERIVRCIIQNEANAEALKEMLGDSEGEGTVQLSSVDATSSLQDGAPSHHHTVHLGSAAPCIHCSRNKRPPLVRQGRSKEGKSRPRPGETTVFSVGRCLQHGEQKVCEPPSSLLKNYQLQSQGLGGHETSTFHWTALPPAEGPVLIGLSLEDTGRRPPPTPIPQSPFLACQQAA
uniref:RELT like 2 n=1 Tax=Pipistrellus kuhlii TaxID=59472 RepID=A0A7J7XCB0_PIPKU|nr:RELT like 2 [Pipistrellus kuhlii]